MNNARTTTDVCPCCRKQVNSQFCSCHPHLDCENRGCNKCAKHCDCQQPRLVPRKIPAPAASPTVGHGNHPNGDRSICRGERCRQEIWWVVTNSGKRMPVNVDGTSHFSSCIDAENFKRKRSA